MSEPTESGVKVPSIAVSAEKITVLAIEDDPTYVELLKKFLSPLQRPAYEIDHVSTLAQAMEVLAKGGHDVILADLMLPDSEGVATFEKIHEKFPSKPIIVVTGMAEDEVALEVMRKGAQDFMTKSALNTKLLARAIPYAIERKKAQHDAFLVNEKYRTIFENSAVAIMMADPQERIISWNKFTENFLKMTPKDLCLKPVSSLYSEMEWRRIRSYNIREKGVQHTLETQVMRKDGVVLDVDISISVLKDENGKITGSIGILKDISERKRAARDIQRAEEKYRTIFENSAVAITVTDEEERIVSWNKFAEDFLGMTYEDLYLRPVGSLYPEEEWTKMRSYDIRRKGMQHVVETRVFRKDGSLLDVDISIRVLKDAHGKITGSIGIMKDITERKKLQHLKDEFVSTVSHELRTPLSIVRESIAQAAEGILGPTTPEQQKVFRMSVASVDRLTRIINDLLDVSKIEAQKLTLYKERFDLLDALQILKAEFSGRVREKNLKLDIYAPTEKLEVYADKDRVIQIFTNLISNAVKFTDQGQITISCQDAGGLAECSVTDTGCGIPEEYLPKIFSRFEQFGAPKSGIEKGTGLGLSICKGIVQLHGGEIRVEPNNPQGTRVIFTLPR
ncbi:MAG TPA: PAS domain S-box protein [Verrucomicrobiae bacterium]|jgi:PAS domain S-box-containing protein|nr:PAS domain S-box protein [Verrucomicrobiae bacterium]